MRQIIFYQISTSDIRSIGIAQGIATIFAAAGTFCFSQYLDYESEIAALVESGAQINHYLQEVHNFSFIGMVFFWSIALIAYLWQGAEIRRIKKEHGEKNIIRKFFEMVLGVFRRSGE